jgi:hypothetical protein
VAGSSMARMGSPVRFRPVCIGVSERGPSHHHADPSAYWFGDDAWVRCGGARPQRPVPDPDPPGRGRTALGQAEAARLIVVGDNVWLGGGVIVGPGVGIGENSVVGAGAESPDVDDDCSTRLPDDSAWMPDGSPADYPFAPRVRSRSNAGQDASAADLARS